MSLEDWEEKGDISILRVQFKKAQIINGCQNILASTEVNVSFCNMYCGAWSSNHLLLLNIHP